MIKGWELAKLIYLGEIIQGTLIEVYINNELTTKFIYENGLRYTETSETFPKQLYKDKEVASSYLFMKEFMFKIL